MRQKINCLLIFWHLRGKVALVWTFERKTCAKYHLVRAHHSRVYALSINIFSDLARKNISQFSWRYRYVSFVKKICVDQEIPTRKVELISWSQILGTHRESKEETKEPIFLFIVYKYFVKLGIVLNFKTINIVIYGMHPQRCVLRLSATMLCVAALVPQEKSRLQWLLVWHIIKK